MIDMVIRYLVDPFALVVMISSVSLLASLLNCMAPIKSFILAVLIILPTLILYRLTVIMGVRFSIIWLQSENYGFVVMFGIPLLVFCGSMVYFFNDRLRPPSTNGQWRILVALLSLLLIGCGWFI